MLYFCVAKPIGLYYIYAVCHKKRSGKIEILHFFRVYAFDFFSERALGPFATVFSI